MTTISWPQPLDYMEAIQMPRMSFAESHLQAAGISCNPLGIPEAATGKSAVVFRASAGSRDVAIRCFTRQASGQRERYQALHAHLASNRSPYLVDFTYRDREILVRRERYPVVEMDWVTGEPLASWVKEHLQEPVKITGMAENWRTMAADLRARNIAHGDLSSDNCLIDGTRLTLVDYDGCFVPALRNSVPGEAGDPDFQHPRRGAHYGIDIDRFPALVVYLSLLALARSRSLWKYQTGKNLIFSMSDYAKPRSTPVWRDLTRLNDPVIQSLTRALADMCDAPANSLPPLAHVVESATAADRSRTAWWQSWPAPTAETQDVQLSQPNRPWWKTRPDLAASVASETPAQELPSGGDDKWWETHDMPPEVRTAKSVIVTAPKDPMPEQPTVPAVPRTPDFPSRPAHGRPAYGRPAHTPPAQGRPARDYPVRTRPVPVPARRSRPVPAAFFIPLWLLALATIIIGIVAAIHHY